jgi:acetyltransferase-like isoleucine patch superfamily enzyme
MAASCNLTSQCGYQDEIYYEAFKRGCNSKKVILFLHGYPANVGEAVGIQMNVVIPRGVTVGKNSIISANTVLRQNIPENCLAYSESELRIKHGFQSGLKQD